MLTRPRRTGAWVRYDTDGRGVPAPPPGVHAGARHPLGRPDRPRRRPRRRSRGSCSARRGSALRARGGCSADAGARSGSLWLRGRRPESPSSTQEPRNAAVPGRRRPRRLTVLRVCTVSALRQGYGTQRPRRSTHGRRRRSGIDGSDRRHLERSSRRSSQPRDLRGEADRLRDHRRIVDAVRGHPLGGRHREPGAAPARRQSGRRAADEEHPFGYGRERYFWSFVVAVVLFTLGSVFAIYEGIHKIQHPRRSCPGGRVRHPRRRDRAGVVLAPHRRHRVACAATAPGGSSCASQDPRAPGRPARGPGRDGRSGGRVARRVLAVDRQRRLRRHRLRDHRRDPRCDRDLPRHRDEEPADRRAAAASSGRPSRPPSRSSRG